MHRLRLTFRRHARPALWLVGFVLLLRMIVPTGYMIAGDATGHPTVILCDGVAAVPHAAMAGMAHHAPTKKHAPADVQPCAFALVATPAVSAADPVLLVAAVRFIVASAYRVAIFAGPASAPAFLIPPPTGPPATA